MSHDSKKEIYMKRKKRILCLIWAVFLFGFTVYAALDTFVIQHPYTVVEEKSSIASTAELPHTASVTIASPTASPGSAEAADAAPEIIVTPEASSVPEATATAVPTPAVVSTRNSYSDGNISITIEEARAFNSTVYVADVVLSSPEYLQTAFANSAYGRNVTDKTSSIAQSANAILAINGDYYGAREAGYVIRNGVLYRSKASRNAEDLVIYQDGTFGIINESQISAQALLDGGAWNVFSFGPPLLIDGEITVNARDEVGRAMASNPRTAIGIIDTNHFVFVVSDGRTEENAGLSLYELAEVMEALGAETAYNLDGGGSSTMVFNGTVVNDPTGGRAGHGSGSERKVSDIVYIGY